MIKYDTYFPFVNTNKPAKVVKSTNDKYRKLDNSMYDLFFQNIISSSNNIAPNDSITHITVTIAVRKIGPEAGILKQ